MTPLLQLTFFGTACGVTIVLHILALAIFPRLKLLDFPERYGLKRARIPYPTGILAVITFVAFFPLLVHVSDKEIGLLISIVLLAVTAFIDDRRPLPAWVRLITQVLICVIIFASGSRIYTITNPLEAFGMGTIIPLDRIDIPSPWGPLPLLSGLFTIMWLGLTMNALNWFDGIPGQVSAISIIGFLLLGCLALSARVDQPALATMAFTLAGIATACLIFDIPPPRVLMGDTGAMFFGLMLGVLGIYQGGKVATAFLALGIPLFDALFVALRRLLRGTSPLRGDRDHLHHRLLAHGWSPRQVILLTAGIGTAFGVAALFLTTAEKGVAVALLFVVMLVLTALSRPLPR